MSKNKSYLLILVFIIGVVSFKLWSGFPLNSGEEKSDILHHIKKEVPNVPDKEDSISREDYLPPSTAPVDDPVALDSNQVIFEEYQKRYAEIKKKLKEMEFDYKGMSEELRRRLKASKNGKLSREEILELFPPEIAKEYGEMLDLLLQLDKDSNES